MILTTIEYQPPSTMPAGYLDLEDLRIQVESITGDVFEEEQYRVEVRLRQYGEEDQFERPMFFTIDVAEHALHHDPEKLASQFIVEIKEQIPHLPPFRVWVRVIAGSFTDSN